MSVFFNGRLYVSPATVSAVDDSAMANTNANVGNVLALIGTSEGGKPFEALRFGSASEARAVLRGGEMLKAIEKAFDSSSQAGAPATVVAVRVNPAAQSTLALVDDTSVPSINLQSEGWGLFTGQIKVKIETGTTRGKKVTAQLGAGYYVADNLARNVLVVSYSGAAVTATVSAADTYLRLREEGAIVADIDLGVFTTLQQVLDRINAQAGFSAALADVHADAVSNGLFDGLVDASVREGAVTVTGNVGAIVDWFNSNAEGLVTATRAGAQAKAPKNIPFTFLSGGVDGTATVSDWQKGFDALQTVDVQWVVPITASAAVHAMASAHCTFMSTVARLERRTIVGTATGTSDADALLAAKALNSDRVSLVHLGFYDYDASGKLALFPPYILAAQIAGAFAGVNPGTALTNKSLKISGLERKLRNPTDTDPLILGGVLCVEDTPKGYKVVKSISTWLNNQNFNRVEVSCGVALDFVCRSVREVLDELRGAKGTPEVLAQAVSRTDSVLRRLALAEPAGPGVIVGDKASPAFKNITARLDGDILRVEFQCSPVIPVNYIPVAVHAVPYSGSASA